MLIIVDNITRARNSRILLFKTDRVDNHFEINGSHLFERAYIDFGAQELGQNSCKDRFSMRP